MNIAYFDCFSGASGDMILGSLVDAGVDGESLRRFFEGIPVSGYSLTIEKVVKQGFAATRVNIQLDETEKQPHRHLKHVVEILEGAELSESVRDRAIRVFERLAQAEADVHGTSIEKVHFHEVGAVDAILDIAGACWGLESLGIDRMVCSPIPTGSGTVMCAHGEMPIPAPATARLLQGIPLRRCDEVGELTTPTGAAILTTLADEFGNLPAMRVDEIGLGAGFRDGQSVPNCLRIMVGTGLEVGGEGCPASGSDGVHGHRVILLEANLDDTTPEIVGYTLEMLLNAGALDAYCVPIQMKKSRPGMLLTVLCEASSADLLESILFEETSTLGVRRREMLRTCLSRRHETVETPYGSVRIKIGNRDGEDIVASPEFDDCRTLAESREVPLRVVMDAARMAWSQRSGG